MNIENTSSIIHDFINKTKESICYLSINEYQMLDISNRFKDTFFITDLKDDISPLKPFLSLLKSYKPKPELVDKFAYSLHKDIFNSYFKTGLAALRKETIIEQEYYYEKNRFRQAIVKMLERLNVNKIIFLNAQYMYEESFEILKMLEETTLQGKLVFCFDSVTSELKSDCVRTFLEHISNKRNFLHVNEDIIHQELPQESKKSRRKIDTVNPYTEISDFDTLHQIILNNRIFLSNEQAIDFASWLNDNLFRLNFSIQQKRQLYLEIAITNYEQGFYDEAVLPLNNILEFLDEDEIDAWATFYLSKVFLMKKSVSIAWKYALQTLDKLKNNQNTPFYALSVMNEYYVSPREDTEETAKKYLYALELLEKAGLYNNYVQNAVNIPWLMVSKAEHRPQLNQILNKCIKFAKELDNQHLISSTCHWQGIINSFDSNISEAMRYYEECNAIRTEIGETEPLLAIRNGLSYETLNLAQYERSYNIVNDIVPRLYQVSDFAPIIDTLKNLSYAIFYSHNYELADTVFKMILSFMNTFNLENSPTNSFLPSINDILIYKSIISMSRDDFIHARMNYTSIRNNSKSISSIDKPLLHFIKAAILLEQNQTEEIDELLDKCINEFNEVKNQEHKICFMYYEMAIIANKLNHKELSEKYLSKGHEIAIKHNFEYYTKNKEKICLSDYLENFTKLEELKINLPFLQEKAEKDSILNQLHNRIYDYQFLNKIKTFDAISNLDKYLEKIIHSIFDYIMIQSVYIVEKIDEIWEILCSVERENVSKNLEEYWEKIFYLSLKNPESLLMYSPENDLYFANLSKYGFRGGIIIVPYSHVALNNETLNIINIGLASICSQITIFKQNENLRILSETDQLSHLNNRHSLQLYMDNEASKVKIAIQKKKKIHEYTIAFLDMDDFKFYNDTYGHEAGDLLIQGFSDLLKNNLRASDFVARFGGDEFVIIMKNSDFNDAEKILNNLFKEIENQNFLIPLIQTHIQESGIEVPEEHHLSFSAGLCSTMSIKNPYDFKIALKNADKALFVSKEKGKKRVTRWTILM